MSNEPQLFACSAQFFEEAQVLIRRAGLRLITEEEHGPMDTRGRQPSIEIRRRAFRPARSLVLHFTVPHEFRAPPATRQYGQICLALTDGGRLPVHRINSSFTDENVLRVIL